jgi:metacaspase-1
MKKLALCIGINDYPGTGSDLAGCVNDANDWKAALKGRGFTVDMLLDQAATGKAIRGGIQQLIKKAVSGDVVVIQFSGHGSYVPDADGDEADQTDECICPADLMSTADYITDDELSIIFASKAPGVRLVFVADSCHSGTVARFAPITTPPTTRSKDPPTRKVRFLPPATFLAADVASKLGVRSFRPASPPGRTEALLLAGCQDNEYSYDARFNNRPNGAFTYVALQELAKNPKTYADWCSFTFATIPTNTKSVWKFGNESMESPTIKG